MLRARWVVAWVVATGLSGCGRSMTEPELLDRLLGDWAWVDATGGLAGVTLTPESEGYTQTLRFYPGGELELFRDGISVARTDLSYFVGDDGGSDNLHYGDGPFGFPSSVVAIVPGDTLLLVDPCCDGFERRWARPPPED